jgi:uncharacterized HAD superfamily protein
MIIINVAVDLDGVCSDFVKKFSTMANEMYGKKCHIITDLDVVKHWDWHKWYPIKPAEEAAIWEKILKTRNFWTSMEVFNRGQWEYFIDKIGKANNINVYFITNRAETVGVCATKQSAIWLEKNGWRYPYVIKTEDKEKFIENLNIEYFIDDKAENLISVKKHNPTCKIYAQDALYNKNTLKASKIDYKRVSGLRQFADDILDDIYKREYNSEWKT